MSHRLRRGLVFVAFCLGLAAALPLLSRGDGPPLGGQVRPAGRRPPLRQERAARPALRRGRHDGPGRRAQEGRLQARGADDADQRSRRRRGFCRRRPSIRTALNGLLADRTAGDSVLVAFAGHGVQYQGEDENYFCPMDAKLADKATLISLGEVYRELEKSEAGTRLLLGGLLPQRPALGRGAGGGQGEAGERDAAAEGVAAGRRGGVFQLLGRREGVREHGTEARRLLPLRHRGLAGQGRPGPGRPGRSRRVGGATPRSRCRTSCAETYGDDVRQMPELIGKTHGMVALVKLDGGRPMRRPR